MIIALIGSLGKGKTLGMTMLGHYLFFETKYDRVVSNYKTDLTTDYVENPVELDDVSENVDGIYLMDEFWAWIDSRDSQENELMNEMVLNSRKRGCLIIYTVQGLHMVDKRLRTNTDYIGICSHYESHEVGLPFDVAEIKLFNSNGELVRTFTYNAETYYGVYDTEEEIATKSESDMFAELINEHLDEVETGKFEHKNELVSHLHLEHDISRNKAEDITNEIFRRVREKESVESGEAVEKGGEEFEKPSSKQESVSEALKG